jgi:hypothetical protein
LLRIVPKRREPWCRVVGAFFDQDESSGSPEKGALGSLSVFADPAAAASEAH